MENQSASSEFPPAPRAVQRRDGSPEPILNKLLTVPWVIALLMLALFWTRDACVRFAGTPVTTHITRKWESQGRRSHNYHVGYAFTLDGQTIEDDDQVSGDIYFALTSPLPAQTINFLGYRTTELMLGRWAYWDQRAFLMLLTFSWSVILVIHTRQVWWLPGIERRVLSRGQITSVVIDKRSSGGRGGPGL